jgi:hypothetical protein
VSRVQSQCTRDRTGTARPSGRWDAERSASGDCAPTPRELSRCHEPSGNAAADGTWLACLLLTFLFITQPASGANEIERGGGLLPHSVGVNTARTKRRIDDHRKTLSHTDDLVLQPTSMEVDRIPGVQTIVK